MNDELDTILGPREKRDTERRLAPNSHCKQDISFQCAGHKGIRDRLTAIYSLSKELI